MMPYFRVDDGFHAHRKVAKLSLDDIDAIALWTLAGSWCADQLTGGWLPQYVAARLHPEYQLHAEALVRAGLWHEAVDGEGEHGWVFHGWSAPGRNPDAEQVKAERAATAERQRRFRNRVKGVDERNGVTHGVSNAGRNGVSNATVTDPFPFPSTPFPSNTTTPPSAAADDVSTDSKPKRKRAPRPVAERFDEFWQAYPRRVGKIAAEKAYAKALTAGASPDLLISGAKFYAMEKKLTDPQYVKHPATWLNAGCWQDEPDPQYTPPPVPAAARGDDLGGDAHIERFLARHAERSNEP
jgi:hypothetical protein